MRRRYSGRYVVIARFASRRLAIGQGLAEWALERRSPEAVAQRQAARRWLRPHLLALALVEAIAENAGSLFLSLFRKDDCGHIHVRARGQAIAFGLLLGLLTLSYELITVWAFEAGYSYGMSEAARVRWKP